jgi:hypothetical protein
LAHAFPREVQSDRLLFDRRIEAGQVVGDLSSPFRQTPGVEFDDVRDLDDLDRFGLITMAAVRRARSRIDRARGLVLEAALYDLER